MMQTSVNRGKFGEGGKYEDNGFVATAIVITIVSPTFKCDRCGY